MQRNQYETEKVNKAISLQLLRMLLRKKVINQSTYDKIMKLYKGKEAA